jgi:hypothetical protein
MLVVYPGDEDARSEPWPPGPRRVTGETDPLQQESGMNHLRDDIRIDAPIEHVWAFLCDTSHWHDWDPRSEYSDFSGPIDRVGTTYVDTSRFMGFEMKGTNEVVEVDPPWYLHIRSDFGPMDVFYRLEEDGRSRTRVLVEATYEMPGHLPGWIKDLMTKSWVERYTRQQLEDFKALAELRVPATV